MVLARTGSRSCPEMPPNLRRQARQPAIGHARDRVLLMGSAAECASATPAMPRAADVAACAQHGTRLHSLEHAHGLSHRIGNAQRREATRSTCPCPECPPHAPLDRKPLRRHQPRSMLPGTPSHTTATPRARSTFATASAGNTCPPVPPAMMSTGPPLIGCLRVCARPPSASCT